MKKFALACLVVVSLSGCAALLGPPAPPLPVAFKKGWPSEKKGITVSPFWSHGLVDTEGLPPGTEVLDPHTKRLFIVP